MAGWLLMLSSVALSSLNEFLTLSELIIKIHFFSLSENCTKLTYRYNKVVVYLNTTYSKSQREHLLWWCSPVTRLLTETHCWKIGLHV